MASAPLQSATDGGLRPGVSSAVYEAYYKTLGDFTSALESQLSAATAPALRNGAAAATAASVAPAATTPTAHDAAPAPAASAPEPASVAAAAVPSSPLALGASSVAVAASSSTTAAVAAARPVEGSNVAESALCELVEQLSDENRQHKQEIATLREDLLLTKDCIEECWDIAKEEAYAELTRRHGVPRDEYTRAEGAGGLGVGGGRSVRAAAVRDSLAGLRNSVADIRAPVKQLGSDMARFTQLLQAPLLQLLQQCGIGKGGPGLQEGGSQASNDGACGDARQEERNSDAVVPSVTAAADAALAAIAGPAPPLTPLQREEQRHEQQPQQTLSSLQRHTADYAREHAVLAAAEHAEAARATELRTLRYESPSAHAHAAWDPRHGRSGWGDARGQAELEMLRRKLRAAAYTFGGANLAALFARLDKSRSGFLSLGELHEVANRLLPGQLQDAEVWRLLVLLDSNGDGEVSLDEFMAFVRAPDSEHAGQAAEGAKRKTGKGRAGGGAARGGSPSPTRRAAPPLSPRSAQQQQQQQQQQQSLSHQHSGACFEPNHRRFSESQLEGIKRQLRAGADELGGAGVAALFAQLNAGGLGGLSLGELHVAMKTLLASGAAGGDATGQQQQQEEGLSEAALWQLLRSIDADQDGRVSLHEFKGFLQQQPSAWALLYRLHTLASEPSDTRPSWHNTLSLFDDDSDGILNPGQLRAAIATLGSTCFSSDEVRLTRHAAAAFEVCSAPAQVPCAPPPPSSSAHPRFTVRFSTPDQMR